MSRNWHRWAALAFMTGSALFLANKLDEMSAQFLGRQTPDVISGDSTVVILLGQLIFALGFVAYFRFYVPGLGRGGRTLLGLFAGGGVLTMLGHAAFLNALWRSGPLKGAVDDTGADPYFLIVVGLFAMLIGLVGFGIVAARQPVLSRWRWLPLVASLGLMGFMALGGEEITLPFIVVRTVFGLALFGLGLEMWLATAPARAVA